MAADDRVHVTTFLDCDGTSCTWVAVAAAFVDGTGYLYGLKRSGAHGRRRWSVYRWRASSSPARAELVHAGAYSRDYAEQLARDDAQKLAIGGAE